ncbi:MAG: MiaB/RimO family radical SAM methylthiotransferase [Candidatus Omnitrophica bacterium]|nr:MiaB/RimO family radical SAM methylthiotransferase [Candidatus Omnitrophota bacterium]
MKHRKPTIGIVSLGCPRNLVDSESILGRLQHKGYRISDIDKADVALVNTCAFIQDSKQESIDAILDVVALKKEGKLKKVIVCGCLSQRYKGQLLKEIPEIDAFVGTLSLNHTSCRFPLTPEYYAYLKICEGCVNNCSYCVIPRLKRKFESMGMDELLQKAAELDREKISEINIIGQDITGYGMDLYGQTRLEVLLRKILAVVKHAGWIRLLYLYPSRVNDELLSIIRDEPRVCKYIDLPIQHISDRILRKMNRKTTKKQILSLIGKIRRNVPGVALRTSLITGFPSETDGEFKEMLEFMEDIRFERLGAFIYSREEGTKAYSLPGQIPRKIKVERFNRIMAVQQAISAEVNKGLTGKKITALVEEKGEGYYLGRSQYDAPEVDGQVYIHSGKELKPGDFVPVEITDTLEYDLVGRVVQ